MFRFGTSQGGLDILAIIARKDWNMNIGSALLGMNLIIVLIASVLFGLTRGLYTIVAMYIGYQVVDKVISGFDVKKQILIVSKHSHEIAQRIMVDPHRGCLLYTSRCV